MDWGILISVAGVLLTLASVVIGVLAYHRMRPKRRLEWWVDSTRLVATEDQKQIEGLEVNVRGIEVSNPYLNRLYIVSNSRADVASSAFDSSKPIVINVTKGGAVQLQNDGFAKGIKIEGAYGEGLEWAKFEIPPQLIRKRTGASLTFVSSGAPTVSIDSTLIDVDIRLLKSNSEFTNQSIIRAKLPMVLSITAGVMMVGVVVLAVAGLLLGIF